jgi:hypothetical protein
MTTPLKLNLNDTLELPSIVLTAPDSTECNVVVTSPPETFAIELAEIFRGPQGPAGSGGGSGGSEQSLTFTQASASATWNITHNFGRYPAVMVVDSAGDLILADVSFTSVNVVIIRFSAPTTGSAYLS